MSATSRGDQAARPQREQPASRLSRGAVREDSAREGRCGFRTGRWRDTEAVVPRLEGRWPSRIRRSARIAGRGSDAPCVGRDDAARAVKECAQPNRATAGRGDNTTKRCDRLRTPRCSPSLEGHRRETPRVRGMSPGETGVPRRKKHGKIVLRVA